MINQFEKFLEMRGLADNTKYAYVRAINQFEDFIRKDLRRATLSDVDDFIWSLRRKGNKHTTINLKLNGIKRFYKFLERKDGLNENTKKILTIELLPTKTVEREIIGEEEVRMMLDQMEDERNQAILAILFNTGMRVSEVAKLNKKNFTEKTDMVKVRIVNSKRNKSRNVFMNYYYYPYVKNYMDSHSNRRGMVFISKTDGTSIVPDTINELVNKFSFKLLGKKMSVHDYRASCFTFMYRQGVDIYTIAKIAGHSNIQTTKNYINAKDSDVADKALKAFYKG